MKRLALAAMPLAVIAAASSAQDVDFTSPDRLFGGEYQLPDNWQSLAEGSEAIDHFNYGAMEFDPATVENGDIFEELTDIQVEHNVVAFEDMAQKISTAVLSQSSTPDIYQAERNYVRLARQDALVDVSDMWSEELWSHYPDWVQDDLEVDGAYYAVPKLGQQWGFYYRPSLLEEAGFDGPPETTDELLTMAQELTTEEVAGYGFAAGDAFSAYESFLSILYMQGGQLLQDGDVSVDTEVGRSALQFLVDMVAEHEVAPASVAQMQEAELSDQFVGGQIAMMGQWDYHYARATNPEESSIADDVGYGVTPSGAEGEGMAPGDFQILAINAFSDDIGAAKLYLDYMRSGQAHANEFYGEGNNTLVLDVYERSAAEEMDDQFLETHQRMADRTMRENFENMSQVVEIVGSQVQAAVAQSKSPQAALQDAQSAIDDAMSQ